MKSKGWESFKRILSEEIVIEYKACLYFSCIIFFYFVYLLCQRTYLASIGVLFEMILTAYAAGYMQVYFFHNSDEADRLSQKDILGIIFCTLFYGGVSYALAWFDQKLSVTLLFLVYMVLVHYCVYLLNRIKRAIDTEHLNKLLREFKKDDKRDDDI